MRDVYQTNKKGQNIAADKIDINKGRENDYNMNPQKEIEFLNTKIKNTEKAVGDLDTRIENIEKITKELNTKKKIEIIEELGHKENEYTGVSYIKIFWIVILGIAIFWGLSLLSYFAFGFSVDEKDIILVFMGALTTFILLSNYVQVKEIRDQMEQERRDMRKFIDNVEKEIMNKISKEDLARFRSELFQANRDYRNYITKMFNQNKEYHGRTEEE
ncbi:hypothetical protein [Bacteroides nordii]|uniref:hypothetical protein n=1 Tax=Bacteroides nordii TaxID=291645 RepID=UPI002A80F7E6|nr:hypothetical protein [Bacteroides nordii]